MNNNKRNKIAGFILTIIGYFIICISCSNGNRSGKTIKKEDVYQFKVFFSFPAPNATNEVMVIKDSFYINYYKDLTLYRFPYTSTYTNNLFDSNGDILETKLLKVEVNFHYLIYKKHKIYGLTYDSKNDIIGERVLIDSFLKKRLTIIENRIYNSSDSLIFRVIKDNNVIQETFVRRKKIDDWDCDTNYLFFSNEFKDIDFSFSRRIDSIKGSKLIKIHKISNGDSQNENFFFRQRRELLMKLEETPLENDNQIKIKSLFDKLNKN